MSDAAVQFALPIPQVRKGSRVPYGGGLRTKYRIKSNGCWIWLGARSGHQSPYGRVRVNGVLEQAHRAVWKDIVGPITPGMDLDHWVCFNSLCVNPAHLQEKVPDGHRYNGLKGRKKT